MIRVVFFRLMQSLVTLLITSVIIFALARTSGSPADLVLAPEATPAERQAYIERMGFDRPLAYQYLIFLKNALQGDFGKSLRTGQPATRLVFERLGGTLRLATVALLIALAISLPLGVVAATQRGRTWDRVGLGFALLGQSVPSFWKAIVFVIIFGVWLRWLPTSGVGTWRHYILPAVTLGWGVSAGIVRLLRSGMLEVMGSEYIKLARAKGLRESVVVWKHGLRNALIPVITFIGFMYGIIIASGVVIEVVFGWPGLGLLAYESTLWRDFPVLQLTVLLFTVIVIVINFLVDVSYGLVDPRVRGG
ncbi:MAG: ABC transporter permease [Proteobacteria bacterium]|nr:ABC transporter permease [Pseudomonadota bacterium]